jgi:hypothetical protein
LNAGAIVLYRDQHRHTVLDVQLNRAACPFPGVVEKIAEQLHTILLFYGKPNSALICSVRQGEIKRCTLPDFRLGPDPAFVALYDAFDGRQPNSGTRIRLFRVQSLEGAKQLIDILHVKADTIIPYKVNRFASERGGSKLDFCRYLLLPIHFLQHPVRSAEATASAIQPGIYQ